METGFRPHALSPERSPFAETIVSDTAFLQRMGRERMSYNPFYNIDNPELMGYEYAWVRYMKQETSSPDIITKPILESWRRCRQMNVSFQPDMPAAFCPESESIGFLRTHGSGILKEIMGTIGSSSFYGIITDVVGRKLTGVESELSGLPASLKKVREIENFSEKAIGTNSFSLVSELRRPVCVAGAQHYLERLHSYADYAAPILGLSGELIGIVGIYTATERMGDYVLQFVAAIEKAIENNLRWFSSQSLLERQNEEKRYILDAVSDGVMYVSADHRITYGNRKFMDIFGLAAEDAVGQSVTALKTSPSIESLVRVDYSGRRFSRDTRVSIFSSRNPHSSREALFNKYKISDSSEAGADEVWTFTVSSDIKRRAVKLSRADAKSTFFLDDIKGHSQGMEIAKELAKKAAAFETRVIIEGDSGTGKEMFAQAIHNEGPRRNGPFIAVDCGALPRGLLESELFGYEEGSFTGAKRGGRIGKFEMADKSTVFLDEVDQLPYHIQPKLLRVLQEREVTRVGGETKPVDIRVIAATNKDLWQMVQDGKFREDLYYRLNVVNVHIPSLGERPEDIPLLANYQLKRLNKEMTKEVKAISGEVMELFQRYDWPGNVRELNNVLEHAMNLCDGDTLELKHFDRLFAQALRKNLEIDFSAESPLERIRDNAEREAICKALELTQNNRSMAARLLKISRMSLYNKMRKYEIS